MRTVDPAKVMAIFQNNLDDFDEWRENLALEKTFGPISLGQIRKRARRNWAVCKNMLKVMDRLNGRVKKQDKKDLRRLFRDMDAFKERHLD